MAINLNIFLLLNKQKGELINPFIILVINTNNKKKEKKFLMSTRGATLKIKWPI